jgi:hypothetical protein
MRMTLLAGFTVSLWAVASDGEDSSVQVGDAIQSENTLLWR